MKPKPTSRPPTPRRVPRRLPPRRTTLQARTATVDEDIEDYDNESEPNMRLSHAFIVVLVLHVLAVGGVFAFNSLKTRPATSERSEKTTPAAAAQPEPKVETAAPVAKPADKPATSGALSYTVAAGDTLTRIATAHKTNVQALESANELAAGSTIRVGQVLRIPSGDVPQVTTSEPKPAIVPAKTAAAPVEAPKPVAKTVEAAKPPVTAPVVKATPAPVAKATPAPEAKPSPAAAKAAAGTYVVAKGDNPYSIAKKLKVTYAELMKANKIEDPTKLQIGQKLVVP